MWDGCGVKLGMEGDGNMTALRATNLPHRQIEIHSCDHSTTGALSSRLETRAEPIQILFLVSLRSLDSDLRCAP